MWSENLSGGATIEAYFDYDSDGEMEILVSSFGCGANCIGWLMMYDYDAINDTYILSDQINGAWLREYKDFDDDGMPEFTLNEYGFCFHCSNATDAFSALTVMQYDNGEFIDVSKEFPELIQQQADRGLISAKDNEQDTTYLTLPTYLFNMYRLDKMDEGRVIFDEVCKDMLDIDCENFRLDVEESIMKYEDSIRK